MIICQCEAISDQAILSAIDDGASTVEEVSEMTGAGQSCDDCIRSIKQLLRQHGQVADQRRAGRG
jgi:bacterioferritin-associated ferredoxin